MVHISEREFELPDAVIGKLLKIAAEDKSVLSLGPGEPDFAAPAPIVAFTREFADRCSHYSPPGGRHELKEAIVKKLKRENHFEADPDNLIITCGSQEAMLLAFACTLDVSEQIIIPNPGFLGYIPSLELVDAFPVPLLLTEDEKWNINIDRLKKLIDKKKTKGILLNSPSNPTGTVLSKKILEQLADIAVEYDLYIYSDEAYERLVYDAKHISIASLNGMERYAVSMFTFSKSYAMCGYRVGYCVANKNLIEAMTKSHMYTTISAPTISQMVAAKALTIADHHIERMLLEYDRRRKMLVKRLNEIGLPTIAPNGAFYTFSNINSVIDESFKFASSLLKDQKVAVVPGKEFGSGGEGYIRCSYATDYLIIEKALERLENFVKKHKKKR